MFDLKSNEDPTKSNQMGLEVEGLKKKYYVLHELQNDMTW